MSSLSVLRAEAEEATEILTAKVMIQVELEDKLEEARVEVLACQRHKAKLERALAVLTGVEQVNQPTNVAPDIVCSAPTPPPVPRPIDTRPICSCGSPMDHVSKTLGNGKTINFLQCTDCNNERF